MDRGGCGECLQDPSCVWCSDPPPVNQPRCRERVSGLGCRLRVDKASWVEVTQDKPLALDSANRQFVQIQPQAVYASLRTGVPVNISLRVGHAENFPVDLYFLMDLSWSMRSSRDILTTVSADIIAAIRNKTDDVNIGFGSFVEKNVPPFTSSIPEFNCAKENPNCAPPYSFYHQQKLDNITDLREAVLNAPLAGNVDDPEGSLDALMQVMVCSDRIGWRTTSRKIIILFTDKDFHFAMDGKLGGILRPNDGKCHLNHTGNGSGYYTMGETQDYPSISHINSVAQANSFIILFAVDQTYRDIYQALVDRIPGSSFDILSRDGSNIVQIVETKYEEISTSIRLSAGTSGTGVRFFSACGGSGEVQETSVCSNVQIGTPVQFIAQLHSEACSPLQEKVPIFSIGLNESLTLTVQTSCRCACEEEGQDTPISEHCRSQGRLVCGECACNPGHYGRSCECDGQSEHVGEDRCRAEASAPLCSGRGECNCGVCTCAPSQQGLVSGLYCQCDDWTCPKDKDGVLCGGRGECVCGACTCSPGWAGETCICPTSTEACVSPYDGEVCSGNGECVCGSCVCGSLESGSALYTGAFCEKREGAGACAEVRECVECQQFPTEANQENCSICVFQTSIIERSEAAVGSADVTVCYFNNENSCAYTFTLQLNQQGDVVVHLLTVNGEKESCPNLGAQLGIGAGVLVLLIGILTICIYKLCIEITDRREYARFQRETDHTRNATNQMPNDIYKSPITKFENPTFGKG